MILEWAVAVIIVLMLIETAFDYFKWKF